MFYLVKTPWWIKTIYPNCIWQMPPEKIIYLTFDDGPHPAITSFVLDELEKYNARATFFCIGNNVLKYPETYRSILDKGHAVGNHSFGHPDGWKTKDAPYLDDIALAKKHIDSNLFRPPYGRISRFRVKALASPEYGLRTVMWSVLSGDFDTALSPEQCAINIQKNAKNGAIIVFHDSEKAEKRMRYALPVVLKYLSERGFRFEKIQLC